MPVTKLSKDCLGMPAGTPLIIEDESMLMAWNADTINDLAQEIHDHNRKWWVDLHTGKPLDRNVPEMLALVHSEISEALEGHRRNLMDDHLPHRKMLEVELADALIRILDIGAGLKLNLGEALVEKIQYNLHREDHKRENRLAEGGKAY